MPMPLSMTEEDAIRQRIIQNWNVDVGAKGIETFFVELRVWVGVDGRTHSVSYQTRYAKNGLSDYLYVTH